MEWLIVAGCFVIFGMTVSKHWMFGLKNFLDDRATISNDEFDEALKKFNSQENYNFTLKSTTPSENPDRLIDLYEDFSGTRHIKRVRSKSTKTTITAFSPEEEYADLPRPRKKFWGEADENLYFKTKKERNQARSNLSRWQKMTEEE